MTSVKLYENRGKETLIVPGVGELAPGERVSIHTQWQPPVILENFPGLADITDASEPAPKTHIRVKDES